MSDCICPVAGYCERYKKQMHEPFWRICRGETTKLSPEKCAAYREKWAQQAAGQAHENERRPPAFRGPGTILKSYFQWFGLKDDGKCGCRSKALAMDKLGPEWCQRHFNRIIGWLRRSAQKRGVPFVETAARIALQWAIDQSKAERDLVQAPRDVLKDVQWVESPHGLQQNEGNRNAG